MAQSLGSLFVELKAETGAFVTGMSKASYEAKKAAKDIQDSFSRVGGALSETLGEMGPFGNALQNLGGIASEVFEGFGSAAGAVSIGITALGGIGVAAIGAAGGLAALAIEGAEVVERLSNISQKTGISIRDLQTFEAAGATVGVSLEDMVVGMRKFDGAIAGVGKGASYASLVLRDLGVSSRDPKEALEQVADAFAAMPDGVNKANDAVALFGKSGLTLIPLLNKGRSGINELEKAVSDYGGTIDGKAIEANENYRIATEKLSLAWTGFKINIVGDVLPALTKLVGGLADAEKATSGLLAALAKHPGQTLADIASGNIAAIVGDAVLAQNGQSPADKAQLESKKQQTAINDQLLAQAQKRYDLDKAGGEASLKLEQARESELLAYNNGDFARAQSIHDQIPALQAVVDLEKERAAAAALYAAQQKEILAGIAGEGSRTALFKSTAFKAPALKPDDILAAAPGLAAAGLGSSADSNPLGSILGPGGPQGLAIGKAAVDDFYKSWATDSKGTTESINADYDSQLTKFRGLFALGEVSQEQFNDVSIKLEAERQEGLKALREKTGTSTFADSFSDMFDKISNEGKDFARSLSMDIGGAIDGLNEQLSKFIVTGKGLNVQKLGQGLLENVSSSILKKGESGVLGFLGIGGGGKKGDSASNPLFTKSVDLLGAGAGSIFGSGGGAGGGGMAGLFGGGGGGIGSLLSKIPMFAGFFAAGGDVKPGKLHVVGENGPEWFVPHTAGRIAPSIKTSNGPAPVSLAFHVHGVTDADSFVRSQAQIFSTLQQQLATASSRSR